MEKETSRPPSKINNAVYDTYGDRWYTADDDPVALLRAESRTKTPWVLKKISEFFPLAPSTRVLDVGCGGGLLSNALAKEGLDVNGVDLSPGSLEVARRFDETGRVHYRLADAYQLPFPKAHFDVVTAMDFLEHVEQPELVVREISRVLKPGGLFFFHTFNRNWLSYLVIIKMVEWLVPNTPPDLHLLNLFITPDEMRFYCARAGLSVREIVGLRPVLSSIPLKAWRRRRVPESLRFKITSNLSLSYLGVARKPDLGFS